MIRTPRLRAARSRVGTGVALGAIAALASAGTLASGDLPAGASAASLRPGASHLLVYAQEWSLWPSSGSIRAGTIDVELWNRGQDAHDLRVRHLNAAGRMYGRVDGSMPVTTSGAINHAVWHLKAGHYEIYCSLPDHMAMGMHADVTVRRGS